MSAEKLRAYRFATEAQWSACLFEQADRGSAAARAGLRPFAPFGHQPQRFEAAGAAAPAVDRFGAALWRDATRLLHAAPDDEVPEAFDAPHAIAQANRLVANAGGLWAVDAEAGNVLRYEQETLSRLATLEFAPARVVDIAADGRDGLHVLLRDGARGQIVHIDRADRVSPGIALGALHGATQLAFLRGARRFVVLASADYPALHWLDAQGRAVATVPVGAVRPCFEASALGSDARARVYLAGADAKDLGGRAFVVILDADGRVLGDLPIEARATGIAAGRDTLLATTADALLRFSAAATVPDAAGEVRAVAVTPMLHSPDREDGRRWLRVDATCDLPPGATLQIEYAATGDAGLRDRVAAIFADASLTAPQRIRALELPEEPGFWRPATVFPGRALAAGGARAPLSAPLFDVREPFLWLRVTLRAAAGARLPSVSELNVRYPGQTLMESLPAVHRRAEAEPGSFLRGLVGVLESTTQDLDARIAAMARHIHPAGAPGQWLDFIARWLGLPWDDALEERQKRCIVLHAAELARDRGTRRGLETLLDCLLPGGRHRVTDATADFGFARVGGRGCEGSALPSMLGGLTRWSPELGSSAVLGHVRLPCENQLDDGAWQLAGRVRVDVAATADERAAWGPWLAGLLRDMVPFGTNLRLRWVSAAALRGDRLDGSLVLEDLPGPRLGTDAVTGGARLPHGASRLSSTGPGTGTRLH